MPTYYLGMIYNSNVENFRLILFRNFLIPVIYFNSQWGSGLDVSNNKIHATPAKYFVHIRSMKESFSVCELIQICCSSCVIYPTPCSWYRGHHECLPRQRRPSSTTLTILFFITHLLSILFKNFLSSFSNCCFVNKELSSG